MWVRKMFEEEFTINGVHQGTSFLIKAQRNSEKHTVERDLKKWLFTNSQKPFVICDVSNVKGYSIPNKSDKIFGNTFALNQQNVDGDFLIMFTEESEAVAFKLHFVDKDESSPIDNSVLKMLQIWAI